MRIYFMALLCVLGIAAGQILFKLSANALRSSGDALNSQFILTFGAALALYGMTTLAWVYVLQRAELGRIYPLMALAFVIVPACSYYILGERFSSQYFIGVALIILGIVVVVSE